MSYERIDMGRVCDLVCAAGIDAEVEHTGGGNWSIYAGPTRKDSAGDVRSAALAGPGYSDGAGGFYARANDFYVTPDDCGDAISILSIGDLAAQSDEQVAALIVAQARQPDSTVPLSVDQVWALGLDGTGRGIPSP